MNPVARSKLGYVTLYVESSARLQPVTELHRRHAPRQLFVCDELSYLGSLGNNFHVSCEYTQ